MTFPVYGRKSGGIRNTRITASHFYIRNNNETFCGICNRMCEIRKTSIRCRRHGNALYKTVGV